MSRSVALDRPASPYDGFGDVDFVDRGRCRRSMELKHRVFAELDAATPGPRDPRLHHRGALDHRDRRDHAAPGPGRRLALRRAARGRDRRGRRHVARDRAGRRQLRPGDAQDGRCAAPSAPGSWSTASWPRPRPSAARDRERRAARRVRRPLLLARDVGDDTVDERAELKAFVEACLVLEEGVAGVRDIDLAQPAGRGRPFARADARGLDEVLAALEAAEDALGRALRAAGDPAPAGRPGPARA